MTNSPPQPGWWLASDQRWYPPEMHHDASYRSTWTKRDTAADAYQPVEALYPDSPPAGQTPVSPSALSAPRPDNALQVPPLAQSPTPPVQWPAATTTASPDTFDKNRLVAIGVFTVAALAITGAFLPWVIVTGETVEGSLTGWQRNDGKATVAVAVLLASLAGLLFVGWRSAFAKILLVGGGLSLVAIAIVDAFNVIDEGNTIDSSSFDIDFALGLGVWVTIAAGALFVVLAFIERSRWTSL